MREYSEVVINAFAMYQKTSDLVKMTGLCSKTILRYKKDNHLMELAKQRRLQIVQEAVYKMQSELTKTVDTLVQIRDDKEVNPQIRVTACNCILNHCRDWTLSVDIMERLEALERVNTDD